MRKATIKCIDVCDRLAKSYTSKLMRGTTIEAIISTSAKVGDRVRLPELSAERVVTRSQWINSVKVCVFTAEDWLYLRGLEDCPPDVLSDVREATLRVVTRSQWSNSIVVDAARQIVDPEPTARPASRAKTRSKPPASTSK